MSETKIKVLVAEDEVHLGQILSNFLGGRGYAQKHQKNATLRAAATLHAATSTGAADGDVARVWRTSALTS